nr:MAG TPA: hypothetical protein [Caudoviricetes sp.]
MISLTFEGRFLYIRITFQSEMKFSLEMNFSK